MNTIAVTKKIGAYRCCICGRFIADSQLGVSAHKENPNRYVSEFAHDDCLAKWVKNNTGNSNKGVIVNG